MDKLTPEQALDNLNKVASKFMGTRQDHELLLMSIEVLKKLIGDSKLATGENINE